MGKKLTFVLDIIHNHEAIMLLNNAKSPKGWKMQREGFLMQGFLQFSEILWYSVW